MKIQRIILASIILLIVNSFSLFAQERITLITTYTDVYELNKDFRGSRTYARTTFRTNKFRLEGSDKVLMIGKRGKNLKQYIDNDEALALLDKSYGQQKSSIIMAGVGVCGIATGLIGLNVNRKKVYEEKPGIVRRSLDRPVLSIGATVVLGSYIASSIFIARSRKNLFKSVDIHNNTITSSMNSDKIQLDGIGFEWNNQASRPQLSLSWTF